MDLALIAQTGTATFARFLPNLLKFSDLSNIIESFLPNWLPASPPLKL